MNSKTFHLLTSDSLTLYHNGQIIQVENTHPNWMEIRAAINEGRYDEVEKLADIKRVVKETVESTSLNLDGRLRIVGDSVTFDGITQGPAASTMIRDMVSSKLSLAPVLQFLANLTANPSYRAREQTLDFVVINKMPIAPDGRFLAYKRVSKDYLDTYSNKISNKVGEVVQMNRRDVDDDPNRTCSSGLHVCSQEYLKSFWGEHLMAVAVNPEDVVAVPTDYNNSKMRVCKYEVVQELPIDLVADDRHAWESNQVDEDWKEVEAHERDGAFFYLIVPEEELIDGWPSADWVNSDYVERFGMQEYEQVRDATEPDDQIWMAKNDNGEVSILGRVE